MGAEVEFSWDDSLISRIDSSISKGMNDSAIYLQGKMKEVFTNSAGGGSKLSNVVGITGFSYRRHKEYGNFITKGKGGRAGEGTRKRFKSKKNKYASSLLGESPSVRTGRLRNSIGIVRGTADNPTAYVGTNLAYGRWLEYGWLNKNRDGSTSHVAARPWCLRALNENKAKCLEIWGSSFNKALLGGSKQ
jgi:phage gpG-like protein